MNDLARLPAPDVAVPGVTPVVAPPAHDAPPPRAPGLARSSLLALRLAWRQLRFEKGRLLAAVAGVMFACVLVFMQLGFRGALFDSATTLLAEMRAQVFLMHPMTLASFRPEPLPRARASQALAVPEVERAVPVYMAQASWRNPVSGARRMIQLVGFDVESGAMGFTGLAGVAEALKQPDAVAFDARSRPEFGPVPDLLREAAASGGEVRAEIGNRSVRVAGLVEIGPSFGADGNAVLSETNFLRLVERRPALVDLVAIRLRDGADPVAAREALRRVLPPDVTVLTHEELVQRERTYWQEATAIGPIFMFGVVIGLVVGMVVVYQILFNEIAGHLREYATLKAVGYSGGHLSRVVVGAGLILAVLGFVPSFAVALVLYEQVGAATYLPLAMPAERAAGVFAAILAMCVGAGLLAARKLRDANPADMF